MAGSLNRALLAERVAQASPRLGLVAPPFPRATAVGTLGSLVFLTHAGTRAYTADELCGFLRSAGFDAPRVRRPLELAGTVIVSASA